MPFGQGFGFPMQGAGGSFSPLDLGGLTLWINATNVNLFGGSNEVTQFIDLSPSQRSVTQVDAFRPMWVPFSINNQSSVRFDGASQFDIAPALSNAETTIFVVGAANGSASPAYPPFIIATNYRLVSKTASANKWGTFIGGGDLNGTTTMVDGVYHILEMTEATSGTIKTTLTCDGVEEATSTFGSQGSGSGSIGDEGALGRHLIGNLCELLVYTVVLTPEERAMVRGYLSKKYAIAVP